MPESPLPHTVFSRLAWILRMAWRDSRRERRKLLLFSSSIVFGIAALVAIGSLKENLQGAVVGQAKALLGADVAYTSRREMTDETRAKIEAAAPPADRAREVSFGTMILFPKDNGTRVVNIRATDPGFPFYGEVVTDPPEAWDAFREGKAIILEKSIMEQFGVQVGDKARVGLVVLPVAGSLVVSPPRASNFSALAPQAFLPYAEAAKTGLLGDRSLTSYRTYLISPPREKQLGFGLVVALVAILGALALAGKAIMFLARLVVRRSWPYTARQGLANLHRPRNQTLLFLLSAGLGACLIMTLLLAENLLRAQLDKGSIRGKSNVFIIDVRPDQREGVEKILDDLGLDSLEAASLVTMRLSGIRGKPMKEIQENPETRVPNWVLRRDIRSTFRDALSDSESLVEGAWIPRFDRAADPEAPVPVSVEEGIAREMNLKLGDTFTVEIADTPMNLRVASLRKVDWDSMGLNFFILFPLGTLEDAPSMGVVTTRVDTAGQSAELQSRAVRGFPNVTIIDVTAIFQTIRSILDKIAYVIRFMALFTVVTGAFILVAVILAGKRDRVAESILLRTLGASRKQVRAIFLTEYFLLGTFSALAGALLALPAGWAVARFAFKVDFLPHTFPLWSVGGATVAITVLAGLLLSRGITSHPPLAILREE